MPTQNESRQGPPGYWRLAESFTGQESVGIAGNLMYRLARYLGGDPSAPILVTSANSAAPQGLPDNTPAQSAVMHVSGGAIVYTMDGTVPTAAGLNVVQPGSIITLTGSPSLRAFQFCSQGAGTATLSGLFYD